MEQHEQREQDRELLAEYPECQVDECSEPSQTIRWTRSESPRKLVVCWDHANGGAKAEEF